jgi:ATP adenylyltransferase
MIVPYEHTASFAQLTQEVSGEMFELGKRTEVALEQEYRPDGFNIGMNLGKAAGAGISEHIHLHIVPRWTGDANFVSIIGETRVLAEELTTTYSRLKRYFN